MLHFILGGARSGKSRYAEQLAKNEQRPCTYIATARVLDAEMQQRVAHHQQQRPKAWQLVEEPIFLADTLQKLDRPQQVIVVDCLTLWMSNLLLDEQADLQKQQCQQLLTILPMLESDVILVSNETGLGVVPMGQLTRRFVDESGWLHQSLGQICDHVAFCVAGFPMHLKGEAP